MGDHRDELVLQALDLLALRQVAHDVYPSRQATVRVGDASIADLHPNLFAGRGREVSFHPAAGSGRVQVGTGHIANGCPVRIV